MLPSHTAQQQQQQQQQQFPPTVDLHLLPLQLPLPWM
jgi:hypothetical protein